MDSSIESSAEDVKFLVTLRTPVEQAGRVLTPSIYASLRGLFADCLAEPSQMARLHRLAPEYGRLEFLAPLAADGTLPPSDTAVLADFRRTAAEKPAFRAWFSEASRTQGAVLLPARWLCHLTGIRHPTVQLFMAHPERPDHVLVQVRSLTRAEAPGAFDSPVAGHVPGLGRPGGVLFQELAEELGLAPQDVAELRQIACYDYGEPMAQPGFCNNEYRTVFACRSMPGTLQRIRFADQEVAAICIFTVAELAALIARFPERVASGLRASFAIYAAVLRSEQGG